MQIRGQASEVILGVDTHKQAHVVAALEGLGRRLSVAEFPADDSGGRRLLEWARQHGQVRAAGVEGTGSYGYRLARQFADAGITVVEVNRPDRSRRRRRGESDPVDAEAAARAVLAGDATAIPKDRQGPVGALRALVVARRSAVKARTQAANQIHALLIGCDDDLRRRLARRRDRDLAQACSQLRSTHGIEPRADFLRRAPGRGRLGPPGGWRLHQL